MRYVDRYYVAMPESFEYLATSRAAEKLHVTGIPIDSIRESVSAGDALKKLD